MKKMTGKEEEIMQVLWHLKKAFVKDVLAELPSPKPHYNTVSTIIRKMVKKGYIGYEVFGNTHRYFPLLDKKKYTQLFLQNTVKNYFDNSYKNLVSFFAEKEKISVEELKEIIKIIENKK